MKKFLLILGLILSINTISFAAFADVKTYTKEIEYLNSRGVINGYEDETFRPEEKVTRAEIAKMIVTAIEKTKTSETQFLDVPETHWAREYINIAVANGLVKGDVEGTFRPDSNITYGEVATILVRAMNKETDAEKRELAWPLNYMKEAEELHLFDGYMTNDLVAVNEARRDNVALMIYNMIHYTEEPTEDKKQEETEQTETKVDTKTAFSGIVVKLTERRGENIVTLKDAKGKANEIKLSSTATVPQLKSFVIYQLNSKGEMKIKKELAKKDIDSTFATVTQVDEELVWLKGQEKLLDLGLETYELNGKTIKLNKYNYFVISDFTYKSVSYKLVNLDKLKLKKGDKIKFDEKLNVCYIVRM